MATAVNIHEAKTQLSKLLVRVEGGEEFVVARAGKAIARLVPMENVKPPRRLGFLAGRGFHVPEDFNDMGRAEIEALFHGGLLPSESRKNGKKKKRSR